MVERNTFYLQGRGLAAWQMVNLQVAGQRWCKEAFLWRLDYLTGRLQLGFRESCLTAHSGDLCL